MKHSVFFRQIFNSALALSLACSMVIAAYAGSDQKREASNGTLSVDIDNFGKVNDHYYRGAQPKDNQYGELASLGVKTIVDLRAEAKSSARSEAERVGLRYINLPLKDKQYPSADAASRFLEIVNDPANWPVYVHCAGGRHRTGAMTAVYRMVDDGWNIDRAYDEMKQYDFYTSWGHQCFKDYVYDYYQDLQSHHQTEPSSIAPSVAGTGPRY